MASSRTKQASSGVVRNARRSTHNDDDELFAASSSRTPPTRAKSGCWTCRLRRKKCDENRRSDGACDTCKRLKLECLGWGAKRPEWCRDKEKVERYRVEIRQQVSFNGSARLTTATGSNVASASGGVGAPATTSNTHLVSSSAAAAGNHSLFNNPQTSSLYSEQFDFSSHFNPSSGLLGDSTHGNEFYNFPAFANFTGVDPSAGAHLEHADGNGGLDRLGTLLAMQLPLQQQQLSSHHPHVASGQAWSNQTTPELQSMLGESPNVNPITSAIDQSMANINHLAPPVPPAWDAGTPQQSSTTYPAFGYLPSLYDTSSLAPNSTSSDPALAPSDPTSLAAHPLLALNRSTKYSLPTLNADQNPAATNLKHPVIDPEVVRKQMFYYFNRVRRSHYCFAGDATKDILRDIVVANPYGVVTNALCALSSIHHICMLRSIGQEAENPEAPESLPRRFYAQTTAQITASKATNGAYTALDALAALQLVSFSLFVGGVRGWESPLQLAGDWFEKTGVLQHETPLRAMWELNVTAKFASRLVVWFDIFSSITHQKPARFLSTYQRMLRQSDDGLAQKFWRKDLDMQATMGCPDAVLLALAETADLAAWKDQQKKQGSLSRRELIQRAEVIEQDLRTCKEELELQEARAVLASSSGIGSAPGAFFSSAYGSNTAGMSFPNVSISAPGTPSSTSGESVQSAMHATPSGHAPLSLPSWGISDANGVSVHGLGGSAPSSAVDLLAGFPGVPGPVASSAPSPHQSSASSGSTTRLNTVSDPVLPQGLSEAEIRRRASRIFLEGASLYLQSVVADSNPNVSEVVEGVRSTMEAAYLLPPSDIDKGLVFPFFIAGCMAESPDQREFFRARLSAHKAIGNCYEAVKLMEAVWRKREEATRLAVAQGSMASKHRVHWRDVMNELGIKLLLI